MPQHVRPSSFVMWIGDVDLQPNETSKTFTQKTHRLGWCFPTNDLGVTLATPPQLGSPI